MQVVREKTVGKVTNQSLKVHFRHSCNLWLPKSVNQSLDLLRLGELLMALHEMKFKRK